MGYRIGIVGGGAAGMVAAIAAAGIGARVTLLEGNDRLGKKILSTGNGRCNLGNEKLDMEEYYSGKPDLVERCLREFDTEDMVSFFQSIGLMIKSRGGYLYPVCEQAAAVLDVLRYEVRAVGVDVVTGCKVERIARDRNSGCIKVWEKDKFFTFDRVILACGGKAAPKTGSDGSGYILAEQLGHRVIPVVPALVQLRCKEDYFKAVAGVRADAGLSVFWQGNCVARERGELQLTDYGISGIPVFQMSRVVNYILMEKGSSIEKGMSKENELSAEKGVSMKKGVEVVIDFLPDYTEEDFQMLFLRRNLLQAERTVEEFFTGMLHKKLMLLFIRLAGLKPAEKIGETDAGKVKRVYELCRRWSVHVVGSNSFDNAQVCAGGVSLDEVTDWLESKKAPGVYFAGEILDVDGKCGGYNLHWAWCSGYRAGTAAAREGR